MYMYILETIFYNCELFMFWFLTSFMLTAEAITQSFSFIHAWDLDGVNRNYLYGYKILE